KTTTSVSLHVRRGDYVQLQSAHNFHGVLPLTYYKRAILLLKEKLERFTIFVFSDDLDWVRSNLQAETPVVYVDYRSDDKTATDLALMSLCKHNIIANSSFSWWGAWLNRNPGKQVIAPKPWFRDKS